MIFSPLKHSEILPNVSEFGIREGSEKSLKNKSCRYEISNEENCFLVGFLRELFRQESSAGFAEHTVAACHSGVLPNVQNDSMNKEQRVQQGERCLIS